MRHSNEHLIIAFADDNAICISTFLQKVREIKGCSVLFTANSGAQCLEELKGCPLQQLPDIIFVDLEMPQLSGIQVIAIARTLYPSIQFIVLTVFEDDDKVFDAIKAGAVGYLLKHESAAAIAAAMKQVMEGGAPMSPGIARKALQLLSRSTIDTVESTNSAGIPAIITAREREVLQHLIKGWDAKRIGVALGISTLTARKHINNIYSKLHIRSKAEVISLVHQHKWI
ncbi:response regulator transcription factor [Chitinophaga pendula]|uniref:response regulator n=1 Tax=Chitinophaga TaxID=79328 RepID=UPI0018E06266|nr:MULTISPECIES: response regulator transcription factor [Chitinophaga]UCJ04779.1 response regulator transcription factor [Chitinophaga pendula]